MWEGDYKGIYEVWVTPVRRLFWRKSTGVLWLGGLEGHPRRGCQEESEGTRSCLFLVQGPKILRRARGHHLIGSVSGAVTLFTGYPVLQYSLHPSTPERARGVSTTPGQPTMLSSCVLFCLDI